MSKTVNMVVSFQKIKKIPIQKGTKLPSNKKENWPGPLDTVIHCTDLTSDLVLVSTLY